MSGKGSDWWKWGIAIIARIVAFVAFVLAMHYADGENYARAAYEMASATFFLGVAHEAARRARLDSHLNDPGPR